SAEARVCRRSARDDDSWAAARRNTARVRQGDGQGGRRRLHAGPAVRHADDVRDRRQAVHRRRGQRGQLFRRVSRVHTREAVMRNVMLAVMAAACVAAAVVAQGDPQPTCRMCPGTYIPKDELDAYVKKAIGEKLTDQQVRDVEIGKAHIGIGVSYELKPGDVVVIPAGTGHWFTKIDDHVTYLLVRIDPDKVTPLKSEADSKAYLAKPHQAQQ